MWKQSLHCVLCVVRFDTLPALHPRFSPPIYNCIIQISNLVRHNLMFYVVEQPGVKLV